MAIDGTPGTRRDTGRLLEGGAVVVTGAAQGIGLATAERLASHGANIVVLDLASDMGAARAAVERHGRMFHGVPVDVTDVEGVRAGVERAAEVLGRITGLVNVAGIPDRRTIDGPPATLEDLDEATFDRVVAVDLKATLFTTKACYEHMKRAGGGAIVHFSSVAAYGAGLRAGPTYASAKAGVIGFTNWLARRAGADGIRVNAVAPGPIGTRLTSNYTFPVHRQAIQRMGTPDEVADAVLYLLSPLSSYVTGNVLTIDGGQLAGGASLLDLDPDDAGRFGMSP